jgi:hypothetical protein
VEATVVGVVLLLVCAPGEIRQWAESMLERRWLLALGRRRGIGAFLGWLGGVMGVGFTLRRQPFVVVLHVLARMRVRLRARICSEFSKAADWSVTTLVGIDASWSSMGARGASLSSDAFMSSILADTFSSISFMPLLLPMDTERGSTDTKSSRTEELEEGIWRRLYSKEVVGRGPGPRRRGGAAGSSRHATMMFNVNSVLVTDGGSSKIGRGNMAEIVFKRGGRTWPWTSTALTALQGRQVARDQGTIF